MGEVEVVRIQARTREVRTQVRGVHTQVGEDLVRGQVGDQVRVASLLQATVRLVHRIAILPRPPVYQVRTQEDLTRIHHRHPDCLDQDLLVILGRHGNQVTQTQDQEVNIHLHLDYQVRDQVVYTLPHTDCRVLDQVANILHLMEFLVEVITIRLLLVSPGTTITDHPIVHHIQTPTVDLDQDILITLITTILRRLNTST